MIERFIESLQEAGLLLKDEDITASDAKSLLHDADIVDVLWLSTWIGGEAIAITSEKELSDPCSAEIESKPNAEQPSPVVPVYLQDERQRSETSEEEIPDAGLPLQVQAAPALPNAVGIGRSLRSLMRKAPSRTQQVLDEVATVDRIAEEGIWIPVLKPAQERWLNLELVIEATPLSFVWESTLVELQKLLERQGAFRIVRTWRVEEDENEKPRLCPKTKAEVDDLPQESPLAPESESARRSPHELIEASGRALVLYVSDCRSQLWHTGAIHDWLRLWSLHGPTTVAQLLPERLWSKTELKVGFKVQVRAFTPGVANPKLQLYNAPSRRGFSDRQALALPIITLTADALEQWAQVVSAVGQQRLPARLFDLDWVKSPKRLTQADWAVIKPQTPEAQVELFNATASAPAQRLARLMSVVPVELPVVHLIQQVFFKTDAEPVHIAEVYDSCLLKRRQTDKNNGRVHYEFAPGVRKLLNALNSINETLDVLDVISQEIAPL